MFIIGLYFSIYWNNEWDIRVLERLTYPVKSFHNSIEFYNLSTASANYLKLLEVYFSKLSSTKPEKYRNILFYGAIRKYESIKSVQKAEEFESLVYSLSKFTWYTIFVSDLNLTSDLFYAFINNSKWK